MAYRETSPQAKSCSFLDDGLQLWEPHDALQSCELGPTALQVTPSEMVQNGQLPQFLFSQSQKEVVPRGGSLQVPEPQSFQSTPVPSVQTRFRKLAWAILAITLFVILVIVLVVVLLKRWQSNSSSGPSTPTGLSNGSSNVQLQGTDVMVDSPLGLVSFNNSAQQAFRVYYQSVSTEIKEIRSDGGSPASWLPARPMFTDAINNTGLASFTYMNGSNPQSSIFYVGQNGYIKEKRNYVDLAAWEPGIKTINTINLRVVSMSVADANIGKDPQNNVWDSSRMAAAYSTDFYGGPQARFFYHNQASNGIPILQEMIWTQTDDSWIYGTTLTDPWPTSHLAVTVDSVTKTMRLFYSAGNLTLQESWLNISEAGANWRTGISIPNMLAHNDANLAAVSVGGCTLVYYAAPIGGVMSIRELNLTGIPGTLAYQKNSDGFNTKSLPVVAQPKLMTNGVPSLYQPIGAAVSTLINSEIQIYVFWAEQNVSPESGYGAIKTVSRYMDVPWGSSSAGAGIEQINLPIQSA